MAATGANLGSLLCTKGDISYYTQQLQHWTNKYEANAGKLAEQVKYEEKWCNAFDSACPADKDLKVGGKVMVREGNTCEAIADAYAHAKVEEYDENLLQELTDLDLDYDTMKTYYDTLLKQAEAMEQAETTLVQNSAADTGMINAG